MQALAQVVSLKGDEAHNLKEGLAGARAEVDEWQAEAALMSEVWKMPLPRTATLETSQGQIHGF